MKIKKQITESKKLVEDDEILDPQAPKQELANDLQDKVSELTDGEKGLSDEEAKKAADEISKAADENNAGYVAFAITDEDWEDVKVVNDLFYTLDDAYENALENMGKHGVKVKSNVLVEGLPGSGKTAIVNAWCEKHGIKLVEMNATDPKIEAAINGLPLRDLAAGEQNQNALTYAYAVDDGNLGYLINDKHPELEKKCVMFVDEFNRQKTQQLRRPFMSIFNEKKNANGSLDFRKNLLFCVICINPTDGKGFQFHDEGVGELNAAELDRFQDHLKFDSNIDAAQQYWVWYRLSELLEMGIIAPGTKASEKHNDWVGPTKDLDEDDLKHAKRIIKASTLALYILKNVTKSKETNVFSERKDADAEFRGGKYRPVSSRGLEGGIMSATHGDDKDPTEKFLNWVDTRSKYSPEKQKMFHAILDDYDMDVKGLFDEYNINKTPKQIKDILDGVNIPDSEEVADEANDVDLEDDDTTFSDADLGDVSKASTDDLDHTAVDDIMKGWNPGGF